VRPVAPNGGPWVGRIHGILLEMSIPQPPSDPQQPNYQPDHSAPGAYAPPAGYPGQAPAYGPPATAPQGNGGNGLAIASVVLGGVGLVLSWIFLGGILALVGLVLGVVALVKKRGSRLLAIIGTAVSALALVISVIVTIVTFIAAASAIDQINESLESTSVSQSPATEAEAEDDAAETATENVAFGETVTYDDGLAVTVSAPETFTPGEYAAGADQAANVVFTITITNGTDKNFDPTLAYPSVASSGVEASSVYDSDQSLDQPSTTVPAGQSVTWRSAFSVADPAQLILEISPGPFEYDSIVYQS
jgi:predicted lipid-binding transport protein (Tim44 family)